MNNVPVSMVQLSDVNLHYVMDGDADKPVLVLSNSLGTNLSMWDGQIEEFSRHFRVLRYDARGHGQSSVTPGPYSIEQLGGDVVNLLDGLGIESCCFCGLSMGGVIGQCLGVHAGSRLRKLVLCNTAAKIGTAEVWNARIDTVMTEGVEAIVPATLERWFTPRFREQSPNAVARTRAMLEATSRVGYAASCAAIRDMDQTGNIRSINVPTLIVAGTHDPVTPPADGKFLADNIRGAQYAELDAAHLSNVEAEAGFNAAVLPFLIA